MGPVTAIVRTLPVRIYGSISSTTLATSGTAGPYREGSLPAKLVAWAGGLKKPFGVPDLMKKFRIKRGHASMLIAYVSKGGAVKRVGRGEYAAV